MSINKTLYALRMKLKSNFTNPILINSPDYILRISDWNRNDSAEFNRPSYKYANMFLLNVGIIPRAFSLMALKSNLKSYSKLTGGRYLKSYSKLTELSPVNDRADDAFLTRGVEPNATEYSARGDSSYANFRARHDLSSISDIAKTGESR